MFKVDASQALSRLETLQEKISLEISHARGLSESNMTKFQLLRFQIEQKSNDTIDRLTKAVERTNQNRRKSLEMLNLLEHEQSIEINTYLTTLEMKMAQNSELIGDEANMSGELVFVEKVNCLLQSLSHLDQEKKKISHQTQVILRDSQSMKITCNFTIPLIEQSTVDAHQIQRDGTPIINCCLPGTHYNVTDIALLCTRNSYKDWITLVANDSQLSDSGGIIAFDSFTGKYNRTFGTGMGPIYGMAVLKDQSGSQLFLSNFFQRKISVYNIATGLFVKYIASQRVHKPCGLFVRAAGACVNRPSLLYICDSTRHCVRVFDIETDRSVLTIGSGPGSEPGQFDTPCYLTLLEDELEPKLFVSDCNNHRVNVFHAQLGTFIKSIGSGSKGNAPGQLNKPKGVTLFKAPGSTLTLLLVCDHDNHRIQIFNIDTGASLKCFGEKGAAPGQLYFPRTAVIHSVFNDELVMSISEFGNKRVQRLIISLL